MAKSSDFLIIFYKYIEIVIRKWTIVVNTISYYSNDVFKLIFLSIIIIQITKEFKVKLLRIYRNYIHKLLLP